MGESLQACRTKEEAYSVISRQLGLLFTGNAGALGLLNPNGDHVETKIQWGEGDPYSESFASADCWALRRGKLHILDGDHPSPICPHLKADFLEGQTCLCLPLTAQSETLGILTLRSGNTEPGASISIAQQQLAINASDHIALAIANLELRETLRAQSIRDPLTGLYNRRFLEESLPREISRARRKGTSLGVILLDLDFFKHFNDTLGHDTGDVLLQTLSGWLQANVRVEDIVCRFGGDEFVLILPEVTQEIILERAHFLCEGVREMVIEHHGNILGTITISLGVSIFPLHGESRDELLRAADVALYEAKRLGRNQVLVAKKQLS
jgi:diguanylate cyclase (GGDEF)-like protein